MMGRRCGLSTKISASWHRSEVAVEAAADAMYSCTSVASFCSCVSW
jgi:hypothetical protein